MSYMLLDLNTSQAALSNKNHPKHLPFLRIRGNGMELYPLLPTFLPCVVS